MNKLEVNIFNKEIAFGLTPFETIYFENKSPHFLKEHYIRLKRACRALKILFSLSFENFHSIIVDYLDDQEVYSGVLKVIVLNGDLHFNIRQPSYTKEKYNEGFKLILANAIRDENNILNYFKTFNYGINYIEDIRAKNKGYDGSLFLNSKNQVCETNYANIFFREGKFIYTPHLSTGLLRGIMREQVIKYAKNNGYKVKKAFISLEDLRNFEECFITNSVAGIFPVRKIEGRLTTFSLKSKMDSYQLFEFNDNSFCQQINNEGYFKREWNK
jgi:4-amino-4-deoxychorismate lyase